MAFMFGKGQSSEGEKSSTSQDHGPHLAAIQEDDDTEPSCGSRLLALKSGFVSLKDRINSLTEQQSKISPGARFRREVPAGSSDTEVRGQRSGQRQFATLQELFSSKSFAHKPYYGEQDDKSAFSQPSKPKIPVMKLRKEDWNVKCWEDRLSSHSRRRFGSGENESPNRADKHQGYRAANGKGLPPDSRAVAANSRFGKPERQIQVFQGRIEDVASKLEKVREGAPMDDKLYKLTLDKGSRGIKSSHEWTDLLKSELEMGVHDPKRLRSNAANLGGANPLAVARNWPKKSPLGRPIRRMFPDDDDDNDETDQQEDSKDQTS